MPTARARLRRGVIGAMLAFACTSTDVISLLGGSPRERASDAGHRERETPPDAGDPCADNTNCSKPAPYCDVASGSCVECITDSNCPTDLCDPSRHGCIRCSSDGDCHVDAPLCDVDDGRCIQCRTAANCGANEVCTAEVHACTARCRTPSDCAGGDRPICAVAAGICVECASDPDCGSRPPHCDLNTGSCVECLVDADCVTGHCTPIEPRCVQCLTNADCPNGGLCLEFKCFG